MNVDLIKLLEYRLPIDGFMLMHCIHNNEKEILKAYIINVGKISKTTIDDLVKDGYIIYSGDVINVDYTLDNISLTDKFMRDILCIKSNNISFDVAFQQLKDEFPKEAGKSGRKLHSDGARCRNLYRSVIMRNGAVNEELHSVILQCIVYEINLRTKNRSLDYFKLFPTWLSQKEWELYIDEVETMIKKVGYVKKGDENGGNLDAV